MIEFDDRRMRRERRAKIAAAIALAIVAIGIAYLLIRHLI